MNCLIIGELDTGQDIIPSLCIVRPKRCASMSIHDLYLSICLCSLKKWLSQSKVMEKSQSETLLNILKEQSSYCFSSNHLLAGDQAHDLAKMIDHYV